jgi:glucose-1-phosphate cytidylyltransferase
MAERRLLAYRYEGFWAPMDTLKDKTNLDSMVESGNTPWRVWENGRGQLDEAHELDEAHA